MDYHDFAVSIDWNRIDKQDGYYATPTSFCNFDTEGNVKFEYEPGDPDETSPDEVVPEGFVYLSDDEDEAYAILAIRMSEGDWNDDDSYNYDYKRKVITCGRREWIVASDSDADDLWREYIKSIIGDLLEVPDEIKPYFDEERYIDDEMRDGDRAKCLSSFNGNEDTATTNNGEYYIYRIH